MRVIIDGELLMIGKAIAGKAKPSGGHYEDSYNVSVMQTSESGTEVIEGFCSASVVADIQGMPRLTPISVDADINLKGGWCRFVAFHVVQPEPVKK